MWCSRYVYGRALHVNPIVTILAVLAGATLLGILGALIAIPTAAATQIVLADWWARRRTNRDTRLAPAAPPRRSRPRFRTPHLQLYRSRGP